MTSTCLVCKHSDVWAKRLHLGKYVYTFINLATDQLWRIYCELSINQIDWPILGTGSTDQAPCIHIELMPNGFITVLSLTNTLSFFQIPRVRCHVDINRSKQWNIVKHCLQACSTRSRLNTYICTYNQNSRLPEITLQRLTLSTLNVWRSRSTNRV